MNKYKQSKTSKGLNHRNCTKVYFFSKEISSDLNRLQFHGIASRTVSRSVDFNFETVSQQVKAYNNDLINSHSQEDFRQIIEDNFMKIHAIIVISNRIGVTSNVQK